RVVIVIARGVAFAPRGERFPAERHDDLLAPVHRIGREPSLLDAAAVAVETKLPRAIEIQPVVTFNRPALAIGARVFGTRVKKLSRHNFSRFPFNAEAAERRRGTQRRFSSATLCASPRSLR